TAAHLHHPDDQPPRLNAVDDPVIPHSESAQIRVADQRGRIEAERIALQLAQFAQNPHRRTSGKFAQLRACFWPEDRLVPRHSGRASVSAMTSSSGIPGSGLAIRSRTIRMMACSSYSWKRRSMSIGTTAATSFPLLVITVGSSSLSARSTTSAKWSRTCRMDSTGISLMEPMVHIDHSVPRPSANLPRTTDRHPTSEDAPAGGMSRVTLGHTGIENGFHFCNASGGPSPWGGRAPSLYPGRPAL